MKVLDIGCGWGGLALYLHRHYGVEVLGVALAPDQIEFCNERAARPGVADKVKFELMDYRDVEGQFDRITTVGLLEHVGTPHYPDSSTTSTELLKPDGVMFSHCCGRAGRARPRPTPGPASTSSPAAISRLCRSWSPRREKHRLIVIDVEAMRFHYCHTLEEWYRRTVPRATRSSSSTTSASSACGNSTSPAPRRPSATAGWSTGSSTIVKGRDAIPMTRDYHVRGGGAAARARGAAGMAPRRRVKPPSCRVRPPRDRIVNHFLSRPSGIAAFRGEAWTSRCPGRCGGTAGGLLSLENWLVRWILLPNLGYWLLWIVGGPPRPQPVLLTGFIGILVHRAPFPVNFPPPWRTMTVSRAFLRLGAVQP